MFDFATAKKSTIINAIRALQEDRGEAINAYSTLERLKTKELQRKCEELLSDGVFDLTDEGNVVRLKEPKVLEVTPVTAPIQVGDEITMPDGEKLVVLGTSADAPKTNGRKPKVHNVKHDDQPKRSRLRDEDLIEIVSAPAQARAGTKRAEWYSHLRNHIKVGTYIRNVGDPVAARDVITYLVRQGNIVVKSAGE